MPVAAVFVAVAFGVEVPSLSLSLHAAATTPAAEATKTNARTGRIRTCKRDMRIAPFPSIGGTETVCGAWAPLPPRKKLPGMPQSPILTNYAPSRLTVKAFGGRLRGYYREGTALRRAAFRIRAPLTQNVSSVSILSNRIQLSYPERWRERPWEARQPVRLGRTRCQRRPRRRGAIRGRLVRTKPLRIGPKRFSFCR